MPRYMKLVKAGRPRDAQGVRCSGPRRSRRWTSPNDLVTSMAELSDVAVLTIGRNAGEGRDRTNTEGDFKLTAGERRH